MTLSILDFSLPACAQLTSTHQLQDALDIRSQPMDPIYAQPLVPLKPVPPLRPHPGSLPARPASLPASAPFGPSFSSTAPWEVQTFVYPAAYPRSVANSSSLPSSAAAAAAAATAVEAVIRRTASKDQVQRIRDDLLQRRKEAALQQQPELRKRNGPNPLWCVANRYAPTGSGPSKKSQRGALTLIMAHANGFSKEASCNLAERRFS